MNIGRFNRISRRKVAVGVALGWAYLATIVAANWAVKRFGIVPIGFGLYAPAAVYFVSAALVLRDAVQVALGRTASVIIMLVGVVLSAAFASPGLALASGSAFAFSESVDFAIFTPLAPRWGRAVFLAGAVAAAVDSLIFLSIAFHSLALWPGQFVGKMYGVTLAAAVIACRRRRLAEVT